MHLVSLSSNLISGDSAGYYYYPENDVQPQLVVELQSDRSVGASASVGAQRRRSSSRRS